MTLQSNLQPVTFEVKQGLLFIPDISGFTDLVHSSDMLTGKQITYELLTAVIGENILDMKISEVEGDAVLFYKHGTVPSLFELIAQYEMMTQAFESKRAELEKKFSTRLELSLKAIAHYGPMTSYKINHFEKLYGEVVVEAHRLLKNSIESGSYLLLTDALMKKSGPVNHETPRESGIRHNSLCELYGSMRNICFTYFDYSKNQLEKVA